MSDDTLSRRAVLATLPAVAVLATPAAGALHPDSFPLTHGSDLELIELRRAIDAYQAAVRYEMSIEGTPGHAAAVTCSDACEAVVETFVEAIHERTPTSLRDVVLRAEALRQWFFGGPRQAVDEAHDGCSLCFAKLYEAAVIVGGADV